ncbi:MAG: DNA replication initiation control protein YabA [Firmicutes bacterium]|nr:DNA replication initiation control protein YabA [Bacillota bacterium]
MGPLPGRIARLEFMVKDLLFELDEVKKLTRSLEQENQKLRRQLTEAYSQYHSDDNNKKPEHTDEDESTLMRLYNEGFHICNVKFAQAREEQCLFCLGLLRRQGDDEVSEG